MAKLILERDELFMTLKNYDLLPHLISGLDLDEDSLKITLKHFVKISVVLTFHRFQDGCAYFTISKALMINLLDSLFSGKAEQFKHYYHLDGDKLQIFIQRIMNNYELKLQLVDLQIKGSQLILDLKNREN